jgi:hypothetical protein
MTPAEPHDSIENTPVSSATAPLRGIAESLARIRHALEHGDIPAARHAAGHLVLHLGALPEDRAAYERLCDEADRELSADPTAWDQSRGR